MTKHRRPDPPPLSRRRAAAPSRAPDKSAPRHAEPHPLEPVHEAPAPFSRLVEVRSLPAPGIDVKVQANAAELAELAKFLQSPAVSRLEGDYRLKPGSGGQVMVTGTARATLTRACVLTLEPFEETVEEPVDLVFAPEPERSAAHRTLTTGRAGREEEVDLAALSAVDPPDPIVDGKVDLGATTTEFVALGLDPYPRKPGAAFKGGDEDEEEGGAFAALGGLRDPGEGKDGA